MILAAEGSDWFWWYGDDHPTAYGAEFDAGFRDKLRGAYAAAGLRRAARARRADPPKPRTRPDATLGPGARHDRRTRRRLLRMAARPGASRAPTAPCRRRSASRAVSLRDRWTVALRARRSVRAGIALTGRRSRCARRRRSTCRFAAGSSNGEVVSALDRVLELSRPARSRRPHLAPPLRFAIEIRRGDGAAQRIPSDGFRRAIASGGRSVPVRLVRLTVV